MLKKYLCALFLCSAIVAAGCTAAEPTAKNTAATQPNTNSAAAVPPEFSGTPSIMTNSAPGIPVGVQPTNVDLSNASTPIPGITDRSNKPQPKTTPGIPSPAELKKQMNTPITNSKVMERKPPQAEVNSPAGPMARPRGNQRP